ncbi:MAG TPA: sensor histidine kinase [Sphingobium sp.]|nr:sensor histidine kinase [Sphingobium sp.]
MFIVLMVALLPLGVVAVIGTIQIIRAAEIERMASLRLDATEGANRLLGEINNDRAMMRLMANSLEEAPHRLNICRRAARELSARGRPVLFAVHDRGGRRLCAVGDDAFLAAARGATVSVQTAVISPVNQTLLVRVTSESGRVNAVARYAPDQLAVMAGVAVDGSGYRLVALSRDGRVLRLAGQGQRPVERRIDRASAPLHLGGLAFTMEVQRPPFTLLRLAATALPIFMWFTAAGIGWWVVHRFLVRPLVDLNRQVAAYQPGTLLDPAPSASQLAGEITMLGDTFRAISRDVAVHEGQLANALAHQRALTREVHHRVKNNLQIIASLINLHSRSAPNADAAAAYASIQRRVDALSVVHRNHYAATELSHGIDAMALISELGSALRAGGTASGGTGFSIRVDCENHYLSQDVAVPTAFLIAELVELVILSGNPSPVTIGLRRMDAGAMAELSVTSQALCPSSEVDQLIAERFGRVLTGLARQLRATLSHDPVEGRYAIAIRVQPPPGEGSGRAFGHGA